MSHLDNLLRHLDIPNLVELYRPVRAFGRHLALADPQSFFTSPESQQDLHCSTLLSLDSDLCETTSAFFL
jgi:hypothetical protein